MARAVSGDHVLFDECIKTFRLNDEPRIRSQEQPSHSYLLTDFNLSMEWQLPNCTIHPSTNNHLHGPYSAFICKVDNPDWCYFHQANLYGIALSSIITFATGRPCKSTRDDYSHWRNNLTTENIMELSLSHPVVAYGPGCAQTSLSDRTQRKFNENAAHIISRLHAIPYSKYIILMQAIRLIHLSILNKREDFGLAHLLVISAIESIAQHAIKRDKVKTKNPNEKLWASRAVNDEEFSALLKTYREARGQNQYLKERYVKFINTFAPASTWSEIVSHPFQDLLDYHQDTPSPHTLTEKKWHEAYPEDLTPEQIEKILSDSYSHRSCYVHRGEQPPHQESYSLNRFFQEYREHKDNYTTVDLLPKYELLVGIAQRSILSWMDSL